MLILREHFKTKMKKIRLLERMLHCVKIDKFKKMTLYIATPLGSLFFSLGKRPLSRSHDKCTTDVRSKRVQNFTIV